MHLMNGSDSLTETKLYLDQAEKYGPLLNLKVAQKKTSVGPVPMVSILDISTATFDDIDCAGWISFLPAG